MSTNGTATVQAANTPTETLPTVAADGIGASSAPEQLSLLAPSNVPLQFRLDERTRRAGLAHVAALRAQIAAQAAARSLSPAGKRSATRQNPDRQDADRQKPGRPNPGRQIAA